MASPRSTSISEEEITLMDASPSNPTTPPTEIISSDEDEILQYSEYHPIGTDNEEEFLLPQTKVKANPLTDALISNLNQRNYEESARFIEDLELEKNDFYGYAQGLMYKIDDFRNNPESLSQDQQRILIFAENMAGEVYLMQHQFEDTDDIKFAPTLIGLNCAVNALKQPHNEDNIAKLADLYNDIKDKPELGASSLGYKIAGGVLIGLGIVAMAACITLALASACILTPAALAGMGFVGALISTGVSMLGCGAATTASIGITAGALSTTTGIGCAIAGSEQGFASSTHGLFNSTNAIRNKLNPEGFDWKSNNYSFDSKETEAEAKAMALS